MITRAALLTLLFGLLALPARADILVFAAASLKEPLDQIAAEFDGVTVSYGGSGTLARQISLGAPVDVVLLANVVWMEALQDANKVVPDSVHDIASNRLVLIGPSGQHPVLLEPAAIDEALQNGRLAVGLTSSVPAGIYAKSALQTTGLWDVTQNRLAEVDSVRAALALVARGQAPLGIVYSTDLRVSPDVVARATFPADSHPPIRYVGAVVADAPADAHAFWDYLRGPEGQAAFAAAGFLPPAERTR